MPDTLIKMSRIHYERCDMSALCRLIIFKNADTLNLRSLPCSKTQGLSRKQLEPSETITPFEHLQVTNQVASSIQ